MKNWILPGLAVLLFSAAGCGGDAPQTAPIEHSASQSGPENAPDISQKTDVATSKTDSVLPEKPATGSPDGPVPEPAKAVPPPPPPPAPVSVAPARKTGGLDAAHWVEVSDLNRSIVIDIKYASEDNFTKSKIYDCPRCFLRPEAAQAIAKAHEKLQERGLGLKMFDCYRPRPYQQRLWDKVPNPDYVTPPKKGSMHSRGAAVDLTIVDKKGQELDMGTPYDFFGEKAHADFTDLPKKVLENRNLLKKTLESVGFRGIRTEWWHFSFGKKEYELSSDLWECK